MQQAVEFLTARRRPRHWQRSSRAGLLLGSVGFVAKAVMKSKQEVVKARSVVTEAKPMPSRAARYRSSSACRQRLSASQIVISIGSYKSAHYGNHGFGLLRQAAKGRR